MTLVVGAGLLGAILAAGTDGDGAVRSDGGSADDRVSERSTAAQGVVNAVDGTTSTSSEPVMSDGSSPEAGIAERLGAAVYRVESVGCGYDSSGSAFAIDEHHLVTNRHVVVNDMAPLLHARDGRVVQGSVIGMTEGPDIAVVRVAEPLPLSLEWEPAADLAEGDHLVVMGYPVPGLDFTVTPASILSFQVEAGVRKAIRSDGALDRGNSGGPALTMQGRVAGVVTEMDLNVDGFQIVPLALTADVVRSTVDGFISTPTTPTAQCSVEDGPAYPEDWVPEQGQGP